MIKYLEKICGWTEDQIHDLLNTSQTGGPAINSVTTALTYLTSQNGGKEDRKMTSVRGGVQVLLIHSKE